MKYYQLLSMLSQAAKYKRLLEEEAEQEPWVRFNFRSYAIVTSCFAIFAFIFCICYSLIHDFKSSTATACGAFNILPSISSAIGGYSPQKEVWKIAITITFLPRIFLIRDYTQYFLDVCQEKHYIIILILAILNFIENCALMSLSFYDSTTNYEMHKNSFVTFIITSEIYMMLLIYLKSCYKLSGSERHGFRLKKLLATINIGCILLAMYYFVEHNNYCRDFTYSKFSFCEYVVVFSNIAYHTTIIYDFPHRHVVLSPRDLIKLERPKSRSKPPLVMEA